MAEHTYPEYLQLRKGETPPADPHEVGVRLYADTGGALRTIQSDGTDAAVGGGGGGAVLSARRVLTNAEVLTLPTTPVEIVAAPGAGKMIYYVGGFVVIDNTAGVYGNVGNVNFGDPSLTNPACFRMTLGASGAVMSVLAAIHWLLTDGSSVGFGTFPAYVDEFKGGSTVPADYKPMDAQSDYLTSAENLPLVMAAVNGTSSSLGNFTGGDPANTIVVQALYAELDVV